MRHADQLLVTLNSLLKNFEKESGDVVIGKMIPIFAALIVHLGDELDLAQKKVIRLTWALFGLTVALLVVGAVQLYVSIKSDQPPALEQPSKNAGTSKSPQSPGK